MIIAACDLCSKGKLALRDLVCESCNSIIIYRITIKNNCNIIIIVLTLCLEISKLYIQADLFFH